MSIAQAKYGLSTSWSIRPHTRANNAESTQDPTRKEFSALRNRDSELDATLNEMVELAEAISRLLVDRKTF